MTKRQSTLKIVRARNNARIAQVRATQARIRARLAKAVVRKEPTVPKMTTSVSSLAAMKPTKSRVTRAVSSQPMKPKDEYVRSVLDPLQYVPPPVLAGTMFPLTRKSLFLRGVQTVTATNTFSAWVFISSGRSNAIMTVGSATLTLNVPAYNAFAATNGATFNADTQSARTISGGCSVQANFGLNSMPPTVYAGCTYDSPANLVALSVDALINQPNTRQIRCEATKNGAFATYRPVDLRSYELLTGFTSTNADTNIQFFSYVIFVIPTLAAYNFEFDTIYHMESNSGLDAGAGSNGEDSTDAVGAYEASLDQIASVGRKLPSSTVTGDLSSSLFTAMDAAIAQHASSSRNFSLRTEGGLVGAVAPPIIGVSASAPPVSPSAQNFHNEYVTVPRRFVPSL